MGQGSAGNVLAAICSFFIPGLGQLVQGRILAALLFFILAAVIAIISLGHLFWLGGVIACINCALWRGPRR
jgi:TM2 domain-containing membrane protein YozV